MKSERILDSLGGVDEKYIIEAAPGKEMSRNHRWIKWGAVAACLALAVYGGMRLILRERPGSGQPLPEVVEGSGSGQALPMLTIAGNTGGEMGYEGYMAYDISELIDQNPWSEDAELTVLPVFKNPLSYDQDYIVSGADFEAMRAFLREVARRLGMDPAGLEITDNALSAEHQAMVLEKMGGDVPEGYFDPTAVIAEENGIKIEVDVSMTAEITFSSGGIRLPDGYDFTHYASYEDILAVAGYLQETYNDLLGMERPMADVCGGDYNIYHQQKYGIGFYDGAGSLTDRILDYHFKNVTFACNDEGELFLIRIFNHDLSGKIGDYPIISADEAETLLLEGKYITTAPYEMPGQEYIAKVELVYRTGKYEECYMPYYRFYVELPEMEREGLKDFGTYYVPAVEEAYITNMPVWDGSFNS